MIKHLKCTGAGFVVQIFPVQFSGQKGRWPPFKMATTQGNKRQREREQEGRMGRKCKTRILWDLKSLVLGNIHQCVKAGFDVR